MKYLLPEAIKIKKIVVHDERTLCMKPDLLISLQLDAAVNGGDGNSGSGYLVLRKMFRARLLNFFKTHPEGDEVPEEILPEPFNAPKSKLSKPSDDVESDGINITQSSEILLQRPSHMSQSFKPHFSQKKFPLQESSKAQLKLSAELFPSSPCKFQEEHTIVKSKDHVAEKVVDDIKGTPTKLLSMPLKLISQTPELPSPKRRCLSPSSPYDLPKPPNRFTRCSNTIKALEFNNHHKEF